MFKYYGVFNIPMYLTLFRIIMVPCFVAVFYWPIYWSPMLCTLIFFIAAITDWFDGFLARRWNQTSRIGGFLDPIADKIMIITALILISEHFHVWWMTLPISSIIIREILISSLRECIARVDNKNNISVIWLSKVKTFAQMLALIALLCRLNEWTVIMGVISLYTAMLLTLWSMCYYVYSVSSILLQYKLK
ncbi:phosphotidylglycerophosphate synthetase [Candidatus Blochmanniella floridana]|uniref:CDP-diacylglycerol--glycerol-3-phosphate 3-phosphatidyltransferase n=1 Tax=Blochmanniella floridana TaxID=203907 RepID=PGSA_BLOFL|nr:RecName: Full=CDP-diacylglycerol--glycerol-3-phosphate 3-phosphatidyltransferase; AltName: Full=Phosphatidylglycerophosphate synthase; Short=PGP synthase [Candidatus Blochmannia floridanus]CAD83479.1 phosphotidylglycerophosphate synthetase [Candidatus Blochmannia floridanus]